MSIIRVLIADDHMLLREGLQTILSAVQDIIVVGEAQTGQSAIDRCRVLSPDVILMDIQLPDISGPEATREILREQPDVKIVALTAYMNEINVVDAVRAGAVGVWPKDIEADELTNIIRLAYNGEHPVHPQAMEPLMRARRNRRGTAPLDRLSNREREVLDLLAQGMTNRDIASKLTLSEATVKGHVSRILAKLKVKNRSQAALHIVRLNR